MLLCLPSMAAAEVWVFFRPDIPLHIDTIKHLQSKTSAKLVFCPVGKTSFSFLESQAPEAVIVLGDAAMKLALTMVWKVKIAVALVDQPPDDPRVVFIDTTQPFALQLQLLRNIMPTIDTVWYPYVGERFVPDKALNMAAAAAGFKILAWRLNDPKVLPAALKDLTSATAAALLPPDPGIMNNAIIQSILLAAFRSRSPVVSFSEALVRQGSVFAYVLSPETLAGTLADFIDEAADNTVTIKRMRPFDRWNLILNATVIEKFKLPLSDSLRKSAFKLY